MSKRHSLKSGEPTLLKRGKEYINASCCDCGLVHCIDIELTRNGFFRVTMYRDNRATGQVRRRRREKMERKGK